MKIQANHIGGKFTVQFTTNVTYNSLDELHEQIEKLETDIHVYNLRKGDIENRIAGCQKELDELRSLVGEV